MSEMIVGRRSCGCIVTAFLDASQADLEGLLDMLRDGLVLQVEHREDIGVERCAEHARSAVGTPVDRADSPQEKP